MGGGEVGVESHCGRTHSCFGKSLKVCLICTVHFVKYDFWRGCYVAVSERLRRRAKEIKIIILWLHACISWCKLERKGMLGIGHNFIHAHCTLNSTCASGGTVYSVHIPQSDCIYLWIPKRQKKVTEKFETLIGRHRNPLTNKEGHQGSGKTVLWHPIRMSYFSIKSFPMDGINKKT